MLNTVVFPQELSHFHRFINWVWYEWNERWNNNCRRKISSNHKWTFFLLSSHLFSIFFHSKHARINNAHLLSSSGSTCLLRVIIQINNTRISFFLANFSKLSTKIWWTSPKGSIYSGRTKISFSFLSVCRHNLTLFFYQPKSKFKLERFNLWTFITLSKRDEHKMKSQDFFYYCILLAYKHIWILIY